ncbi:flagellar biosynthetic protein FliO [Psychrobium sp. 1_MG-2023]|uniref:flagellar biosynthetic protein FliO n=1 Tax=Psychrobium sp. 1_MG-2023 TaxID=3062624 RepID=UPI000C3446F3|nr:flagellar biosynthetic protein FliO [Psychrobium sp. 1_MG-2023]MDP2559829.1 flagellar biosynthetic protein FliO [Psychrobium sp. 1_MG-2023]PKF59067.1 flagellar biosynthetic protein FliO [Alteromonadales bacterium alter-6D02]
MLLVKLNVLKNCAKVLFLSAGLCSSAYAAEQAAPDYLNMIASLAIVLGLIFALAFMVKKLKLSPTSQRLIRLVANLPLGTKERVVVVEVDGKQYLLGVTAQQVNLLEKLPNKITDEEPKVDQKLNVSAILAAVKKEKS